MAVYGKINYLSSAFNKLPEFYGNLSLDNQLGAYMQFYHNQNKKLAWKEKELQDLELKVFEEEFSLVDSHIEELMKITYHPKNITDTLKIWNRDYKGIPTYYDEVVK